MITLERSLLEISGEWPRSLEKTSQMRNSELWLMSLTSIMMVRVSIRPSLEDLILNLLTTFWTVNEEEFIAICTDNWSPIHSHTITALSSLWTGFRCLFAVIFLYSSAEGAPRSSRLLWFSCCSFLLMTMYVELTVNSLMKSRKVRVGLWKCGKMGTSTWGSRDSASEELSSQDSQRREVVSCRLAACHLLPQRVIRVSHVSFKSA